MLAYSLRCYKSIHVVTKVADPVGIDPDPFPTLEEKLGPDPSFTDEKKPGSNPRKNNPDSDST